MMRAIALGILLALSGCGLQPMYAGGGSGAVATSLSSVMVAPIPERAGWLVRNALVDRLGGEAESPAYRLEVELDDDRNGLALVDRPPPDPAALLRIAQRLRHRPLLDGRPLVGRNATRRGWRGWWRR